MKSSTQRNPPDPEAVAREVLAARKYGDIDPALVAAVSRMESPKETRAAEAVKRVKRKLHQMVGAYLDREPPFDAWLARLAAEPPGNRVAACREILALHASTRERLPELGEIYQAAFEGIPPGCRVVDLACGLNPLGRPFMPLPPATEYAAYDVHAGLVRFVQAALGLLGFPVTAGHWNLLEDRPLPAADVTLVLKTLPCLEQADPAVTDRLLRNLRSPLTVVSFPTVSLGGSRRGMSAFYRDRFLARLPDGHFRVEIREFRTELLLRLHRHRHAD